MRSPSASLARALPLVLTLGALLAFGGAARRFAELLQLLEALDHHDLGFDATC
jgi:hypothetical protein